MNCEIKILLSTSETLFAVLDIAWSDAVLKFLRYNPENVNCQILEVKDGFRGVFRTLSNI